MIDYFILPLSMLLGQPETPWFRGSSRTSPGNILVFVWCLMASVLDMAYHCNLRASLIKVEYGKPVETIQERTELPLAIHESTWQTFFFQTGPRRPRHPYLPPEELLRN